MRLRFGITARLTSWIRQDYPKSAPGSGHCYLIQLCGTDHATQ